MAYTSAQLIAAYSAADDATPAETVRAWLQALAARTQAGELGDAEAFALVMARADLTTGAVGEILRFFNGRPPRRIDVNVEAEAVGRLASDASAENHLMGFAAGLGLGQGRGAFSETYGALDYPAFVAAVYETLIGAEAAKAAGYDAAAAIADTSGRAAALAGLLRDRKVLKPEAAPEDVALAVKAATVGYLICEAIKWNFGVCWRRANDQALSLIAD